MTASALDTLRDIHLPPEPSAWLPAPGWWMVAAIAVALGLTWARRYRKRQPLRHALQSLHSLATAHQADDDAVAFACGITAILRQYARIRFPSAGTETMRPDAWLAFLASKSGSETFAGGPASALVTLPYQREGAINAPELIAVVRHWLIRNRP